MERAGIVLCGGRSQRMGRPKALLPWFGRSMLEHVVATLTPCVDEVLVVTSRDLPLPSGVAALAARIVIDREHQRGPLAALRDGLAAARAERAFVTSADAPFLAPAHVDGLFARAGARGGAVVPRAGGFLQVLSAVYPCSAWRDAEALLAAGISSPAALLEQIGFEVVEDESPEPVRPWTGFNTPEAYLRLARHRDPRATAEVEWRTVESSARGDGRSGGARSADVSLHRGVPIGLLGDVLRATAPASTSVDDLRIAQGLRITLGDVPLAPGFDPGLPVGPGERVVVRAE